MRDDLHSEENPGIRPTDAFETSAEQSAVTLRIMATSDLHMQLQGFDYIEDRPAVCSGLAGLATLIKAARSEATALDMPCVLLDNGDFLQGTVLGEDLAQQAVTPDHPVVACMNHLKYDAIGLGNHDLDHGIPYLSDVARHLRMPVISTNLRFASASPVVRSTILHRNLGKTHGCARPTLRIGVVSLLPEQTAIWNVHELEERGQILPARESLIREVDAIRGKGADVVILLAHLGVENTLPDRHARDDARLFADVPGIDAIVSGHTHRRLPGHDHVGFTQVDAVRGMLGNRPAVMPGFDASDLAILDLKLGWSLEKKWQVLDHHTVLRPNRADTHVDPKVISLCRPAHQRVRASLSEICGHSDLPIHNYFSLAAPTQTCALVAAAKRRVVAQALNDTTGSDLPILSSASAHTAGGRGGPLHFLHIPAGHIYLRHLAGLSPYTNVICALRVTGADLRNWLERTVNVFSHLRVNTPDQMLLRPDRPAFDFSTIYGLDYAIDPTRSPGKRITRLRYGDCEVLPDQPFLLATSTFRAAGGGGGHRFAYNQIVLRSQTSLSQALVDILADESAEIALNKQPWRFSCPAQVTATIQTAPQSVEYLSQIAHLHPKNDGIDGEGFARIRLTL